MSTHTGLHSQNTMKYEHVKHIHRDYMTLFNCLSLFLVLIGQKSITWQMVFCPTTGDDVSRSLFDWADRSLFTRTRPIDSVLQVWLTRAESASAQLQLRPFLNNYCWANGAERLIRVKAGINMPKNLWNYMHLSVLQSKTSLLQIVIHLFLLLFHRVYFIILLTISAQSVFQDIVCNSILTLLSE